MSNSKKVSIGFFAACLMLTIGVSARGQEGQLHDFPPAVAPPWAVTVVHTVDVYRLMKRIESGGDVRVGIIAAPSQNPVNITTGLVIDGDGHILTRLNDVDPEHSDEDIGVILSDGSRTRARLIGVDGPTGFAVLKVDVPNLRPPSFASPAAAAPGLPVRILSSDVNPSTQPLGNPVRVVALMKVVSGNVGANTVYARLRGASVINSPELGPRNDGAVVTTPDFKVLGMAQSAGLPSHVAYLYSVRVLKDMVAARVLAHNGSVPPCWLGVSGVNVAQLDPGRITQLGSSSGVVVTSVEPNSNAAEYGIRRDDVIVGIDDLHINGVAEMGAALSAFPAGQQVSIRAVRFGQTITLNIVLGARPWRQDRVIVPKQVPGVGDSGASLIKPAGIEEAIAAGFVVRQLTPQLAEFFGTNGGAIVTSVLKGSRAENAGVTAGDVILGTGEHPLLTASELKAAFETQKAAITLKVMRSKRQIDLTIPAESKSSRNPAAH